MSTTTTYRIADGWTTSTDHRTGYSPLRRDAERVREIIGQILDEVTSAREYADRDEVEAAIDAEIADRPEHYGLTADLLKAYQHISYSVTASTVVI